MSGTPPSDSDSESSSAGADVEPLLKYGRLRGVSLPRFDDFPSSSSVVPPSKQGVSGGGGTGAGGPNLWRPLPPSAAFVGSLTVTSVCSADSFLAVGCRGGFVTLVDFGGRQCAPVLRVFDSPDPLPSLSSLLPQSGASKPATAAAANTPTVTCLSFDSSGGHLLAGASDGTVAVFDLRWVVRPTDPDSSPPDRLSHTIASAKHEEGSSDNYSSNPSAASASSSSAANNNNNASTTPYPSAEVAPPLRWKYSAPSSAPAVSVNCCALDPAYGRKRDKSVAVGLSDGRLLLTKRGWLGRKDVLLHQSGVGTETLSGVPSSVHASSSSSSSGSSSSSSCSSCLTGIQSLAWRGSLLAWSDDSGVKVMNVETSVRIAHVDRPSGAHAYLYPELRGALHCSLSWETDKSLLIAWGDCLMAVEVVPSASLQQQPPPQQGPGGAGLSSSSSSSGGVAAPPPRLRPRRASRSGAAWRGSSTSLRAASRRSTGSTSRSSEPC